MISLSEYFKFITHLVANERLTQPDAITRVNEEIRFRAALFSNCKPNVIQGRVARGDKLTSVV